MTSSAIRDLNGPVGHPRTLTSRQAKASSSWMRRTCISMLAALAVSSGCGNEASDLVDAGEVQVRVEALSGGIVISRVTADILPAGLVGQEVFKNANTGVFARTFVLPVGPQTISLKAFDEAGEVWGEGSATATVTLGAVASADVSILDSRGPAPGIDIAPFITTLVASRVQPFINETIELSATAVDKDGDAISYIWSDDCASSTFGAANASTTTWANSQAGNCQITATVEANGATRSKVISVTTQPGDTGGLAISAGFVANPDIGLIVARGIGNDPLFCVFQKGQSFDATCPTPIPIGKEIRVEANPGPDADGLTWEWLDDCNGSFTEKPSQGSSSFYHWTAPTAPAMCKVTARASIQGLSDEMSMALFVE